MREFTYMFVLGTEIACAGADERNVRRRVERWGLNGDQKAELDQFLAEAPAGAHLEMKDGQGRQCGVLVCSHVRPEG